MSDAKYVLGSDDVCPACGEVIGKHLFRGARLLAECPPRCHAGRPKSEWTDYCPDCIKCFQRKVISQERTNG